MFLGPSSDCHAASSFPDIEVAGADAIALYSIGEPDVIATEAPTEVPTEVPTSAPTKTRTPTHYIPPTKSQKPSNSPKLLAHSSKKSSKKN